MAPTIDMSKETYTLWLFVASLGEISERRERSSAGRQNIRKRSVFEHLGVRGAATHPDVPLEVHHQGRLGLFILIILQSSYLLFTPEEGRR